MKTIKFFITTAGIIFLMWFAFPYIFQGILNSGNIIGIALSGILTLYGVFFKTVNKGIAAIFRNFFGKILLSVLAFAALIAITLVLIFTVNIISHAKSEITPSSTVVVLGCRVKKSGPSLMLSERIDAAYEYLTKVPEAKCILSGGKGVDEPISEARCMYDSLVRRGIDPSRLYLEERSTSTEENLLFSMQLIENEGLDSDITLITNNFHEYRASLFAKKFNITVHNYSADTHIMYLPTYYVRELCGILHYYIFSR